MPAFDTLQVAKELETAFSPEQAEVLVKVFAHTLVDELATKRDVSDTEQALRADIERVETTLRSEIKALDVRIGAETERLEAKIATTSADLRAEMIKWIVGAIAFNLLGTAGLMITLIKMIPR